MGADISILKAIFQPFNHCIDVADDMECKSKCCGDNSSCACDTKNSRASTIMSRDSDATLTPSEAASPKTPAHSRHRPKETT